MNFIGPREYMTRVQASDPVSGTLVPILGVVGDVTLGVGKIFSERPEKGVVKIVKAVPDSTYPIHPDHALPDLPIFSVGVRGTLEGLHHGLNNSPKLYGGSVRESGKITGFRSGVREGGKVSGFDAIELFVFD